MRHAGPISKAGLTRRCTFQPKALEPRPDLHPELRMCPHRPWRNGDLPAAKMKQTCAVFVGVWKSLQASHGHDRHRAEAFAPLSGSDYAAGPDSKAGCPFFPRDGVSKEPRIYTGKVLFNWTVSLAEKGRFQCDTYTCAYTRAGGLDMLICASVPM